MTALARLLAAILFYHFQDARHGYAFWALSRCWRGSRWLFHRLIRRQPPFLLVLDGPPRLTGLGSITGWAMSRRHRVVLVEAIANGRVIASTPPTQPREDVCKRFGHYQWRGPVGFRLAPPLESIESGQHPLRLRAHDERGNVLEVDTTLTVQDYHLPDRDDLPGHLAGSRREYQHWLRHHEPVLPAAPAKNQNGPLISVIVPTYQPRLDHLRAAIASVRAQWYGRWELLLCDDGSRQPLLQQFLAAEASLDGRVRWTQHENNRGISAATNTCLQMSRGDYVAFMDHDDALTPNALYEVARRLRREEVDFLYTDEDRLDEQGCRIDPFFKPDWSPDLVTSFMYVAHLSVYRRAFLDQVGWCRSEFDGAQDWELCLRATGRTTRIAHVPHVLYHWRMGGNSAGSSFNKVCHERGRRAIAEAIARRGEQATVSDGPGPCTFHVRYRHDRHPLVSILIPTRDNVALLRRCLRSIQRRTSYANHELIIIDNGSRDPATRRFLANCPARVLRIDEPFNHSRLNNLAARAARGELLLLLNDDVQVTHDDWLTALVEQALRPSVGAVGGCLIHLDGRLQHAGAILGLGPVATPLHTGITRDGIDRGMVQLIRNVSAVSGACLMIRKELYQNIGGLDATSLPTSFNDVDLCLRLQAAGYRNVYTPLAVLRHHESATRGRVDESLFIATMQDRWGSELAGDPYWNPNLPRGPSLDAAWAFHWSAPPRQPLHAAAHT